MKWNYRILITEFEDEYMLQIHEVYYDDNGTPINYTAEPVPVHGENKGALDWTLRHITEAFKRPMIWEGDKFPQEVKIKYTCDRCGRDNFDRPSAHYCGNNFTKRGLTYTERYK